MSDKFALLLLLCGIAATVTGAPAPSSSASDELEFRGVIDDPDGYVNVRSRPDARSAIIAKVQKGERFTFERKTLNEKTGEAEYDPWCRVKLASGKRGWMEAQRIVLFFTKDDLPGKPEKGDEIDSQARDHGIDYYETAQGAVRGDVEARKKFFQISEFADGEGGEEHEVYLRVVLHLIGDDALAAFLRSQPFSLQISVRNSISDVTWPFRSTGYLQRHFPKTAKIFFRRELTEWASPDGKYAIHKVFSDEYTDTDSTVTRAELIEKATGRVLKDFSKDDEGAGRNREGQILWTDDSQRFAAYSCSAGFSGHTTVYQIAGDQVQTVALPVNDPPGRSADAELKDAKDIHTVIEPVRWSTPTTLEVGREDWFYGKYRFYHITIVIGADGKATVKDYSQEQSASGAFK